MLEVENGIQLLNETANGYEILSSIQNVQLFDIFEERDINDKGTFKPITEGTIEQLRLGVYNKFGVKRYPKLEEEDLLEENLFEIIIRETHYDYLGLEWMHKMDIRIKPKEGLNHICKHVTVLDKDCIIIQCIEHDWQFAKIISRDIDFLVLLDEIKDYKPHQIVPRNEAFEMNELERHGVVFNSTPEKLDDEGNIISNLDHYDNYCYEIYDSLRNTFKHLHQEQISRYAENLGIWIEEWLDKYSITNDIDTILDYWDDISDIIDKFVYQGEHDHHKYLDRKTFGDELYKGKMKQISNIYDTPVTVCWDIWKIKTKKTFERILSELDD